VNIEQIQQVLRESGWCQAYSDGYFYNTLGNPSAIGIDGEIKQGWELVGIFTWDKEAALITDPSIKRNKTVLRKPAPVFFTVENPWVNKGPLPWLPDLTLGTKDDLAYELSKAGGHGSPGIARRFRCSCGKQAVMFLYDKENAKAEAECPFCHKRTVVCNVQQQENPLESYQCECGEKHVEIDLGIEYPVDAAGGWDFSWIAVAVTCCSCGQVAFPFDAETA
jgi:hypothetical protein